MDWAERAASENTIIALLRAGNFTGAEARIRTMLSQNPNDARVMALLAHCRMQQGKDKAALKIAREAAAIEPDDETVQRVLASALLRGGKFKEAEEVSRALTGDDPRDASSLFRLALSRFGQKDYIGARQLFDEAEEVVEDNVFDLLDLARLRADQWNWAAAEALAQRAMMLDPNQSEIFQVLGECALAQNRAVEAYDLALEALRLEPGDRQIMRLLVRARTRRRKLLKPFLAGIDWIVEMDRSGLVVVPLLMLVLGGATAVSVDFDLGRMAIGRAPVIILSVALAAAFGYALVCYVTAILARLRIRRDLRRVSLPDF